MSGGGTGNADLLGSILAAPPPAFALLYRPETSCPEVVDVLVGEVSTPEVLAALPLPPRDRRTGRAGHDVLAVIS